MKKEERDESKAQGGYARAEALTPEERKRIAIEAAKVRWNGKLPQATHQGMLELTDETRLNCAVLDDGSRIISRNAIFRAFKRTKRGRAKNEEREPNMPSFIDAKNLKPFISSDLVGVLKPIEYKDSKYAITLRDTRRIQDQYRMLRRIKIYNVSPYRWDVLSLHDRERSLCAS